MSGSGGVAASGGAVVSGRSGGSRFPASTIGEKVITGGDFRRGGGSAKQKRLAMGSVRGWGKSEEEPRRMGLLARYKFLMKS